MAVREINDGKPCKGCRKPKNIPTASSFKRSPNGRRANARRAQRAAKMRRLEELAHAAEHGTEELSGGDDVAESVMSIVEPDTHDVAHGLEIESVEGAVFPAPSGEVIEHSAEDHSISRVPTPDLTESLETEPVEEESPLKRPVVREWD